MGWRITRRGFLEGTGGALALSLLRLQGPAGSRAASRRPPGTGAPATYGGTADLYRRRWTWDRVLKGTHQVNCWYQRGCCWNVYVREGIVWREEQAATYPQTNPGVPDFNPRGCQKGACYSQRMYGAGRVRTPLQRAGARGEGRWKRISWEQALQEIADRFIEVLTTDGPGAIFWDAGGGLTSGGHGVGHFRTRTVLDTLLLDMNAEVGDDKPGALATTGKIMFSSSADDLFHSDLLLIWGGNPVVTQIPNAHFIHEARYHGAHVVTITPDHGPSAIHADEWIPVNVGTDAALALSLAHVMIEEGLHDVSFVAEQTDLPLLVRTETGQLLRTEDLEPGGDRETFHVFDRAAGRVRKAPRRSLSLGGLDPALEGEFRVATRDGEATVTPVFALLRRHLAAYAPEAASRITGVPPATVRSLARRITTSRAATILAQSSLTKFYHALEMERTQLLVMALAGQMGRKGSGFTAFPYLSLDGSEPLYMAPGSLPPRLGAAALGLRAAPAVLRKKWQGYTDEMVLYDLARQDYLRGGSPATAPYLYYHGGLRELYGRAKDWDPWLRRETGDTLAEAVKKGWLPDWSRTRPRILVQAGGNLLRRTKGYPAMMEKMLPKLDLVLTVDWRMSTTALHSDYVLPAASWYEKDDFTWSTPLAPFSHVTRRAVEPLAEARTDWEFHCLLLKQIQKLARERGLRTFRDRAGRKRRLDRVYDQLTFGGRFTESNPEDLLDQILALTTNLGGVRWNEIKEKGYARFTSVGAHALTLGTATEIAPDRTITANTWHTEKKIPWPTLTRRMQFFIDHPLYRELGEELPVHKDAPPLGGSYPLVLTGGHARWSIHAMWRDEEQMLRLQRGEPVLYLGGADARTRGIRDGDRVRVHNDLGAFEIRARVSEALRPGQVVVHHAWEPYQFRGHRSHQSILPGSINPIQLAGGYLHLQPFFITGTPGSPDRGTRVEVERLGDRT